MKIWEIAQEVVEEVESASQKFPKFNSAHEGFAILKEEVDELWDEVKKQDTNSEAMRKEACQCAAMAMRFIKDLCD